jgi:hypothetical protein
MDKLQRTRGARQACGEIKSFRPRARTLDASPSRPARVSLRDSNSPDRNNSRGDFAPALRFPSARQLRAVELGADELIARAEWSYRARPRVLRNLRRAYRQFCLYLLEKIERGA